VKIDGRRTDLLGYAGYLVAAFLLLGRMWRDPTGTVLADNGQDQTFFEWVLAHAAHAVTHLHSPLFTDRLNAPDGVNLMANTSILALALPLAPVTGWLGPAVTFLILLTAALAGTAAAWYHLLSRQVVQSRVAALVGGAFCGFAPAMISQDTGHPNIAGQFLVPFIVLAVLRLREPGGAVRKGLPLAGLVVAQSFINEEILFLTALALPVFVVVHSPRNLLRYARTAAPALGVTAIVAGVVLAYPLWMQFAGAQSYRGLPEFVRGYGADLASYPAFARRSIAGDAASVAHLGQGPTEENTFFGWPLLIVVWAAAVVLVRERLGRALVVTGVTFAGLSLGSRIQLDGRKTGVPGPWALVDGLPLFDSVVPTRLALVVTPVIGVLLALVLDRAGPQRLAWAVAVAVALLPIVPTPLPATPRPAVPHFFTAGTWRQYVPAGGTVVPVPMGWYPYLDAMRWSVAGDLDFAIVGGYFLAPDPDRPDRQAIFGPGYSQTAQVLGDGAPHGGPVDGDLRQRVLDDLRRWRATTLVMPDTAQDADGLRSTVDQIVGPGSHVDDVWVWDVRRAA
jgi:hypothetical protein